MKINKNKFYNILFGTIFIVGFLVIIYPWVANVINNHKQSQSIMNYQQLISDTSENIYQQEYEKAKEYNQNISQYPTLSGASQAESQNESKYEDLLDISGMGIMGILRIPIINVELPIYHGTDPTVLQIGVGHLQGSSLPIGGLSTHCVVTGHTGLPSSQLLSDTDQLENGDIFYIDVLNQTLAYEIMNIQSVLPDETDSLNIVTGEDLCTIVTCTPYGINTHRLLITGKRINYIDLKELNNEILNIPIRLIVLIIWILLYLIYFIKTKKYKHK